MVKRKLKYEETGRLAHIQMGEYDGNDFALDGDFSVVKLPDGQFAVLLGPEELPPPEPDSPDSRALRAKRNRRA